MKDVLDEIMNMFAKDPRPDTFTEYMHCEVCADHIVTYGVYAIDKSAATKGARRTPENTLHLLSLAGGWPGAAVAQQKLRHKSRKESFLAVFWITVFVNSGVLAILFAPNGTEYLRALISNVSSL